MQLYSYWRSSTSYRVRAALNLKRVVYDIIPIDLLAGNQREDTYLEINPAGGVPSLVLDDGTVLTQSMAIMEYADTMWPEPKLIPDEMRERARVMAVANLVACDIHSVNNSRVIRRLQTRFSASDEDCRQWMLHWMAEGFRAIETMLPRSDAFAFDEKPGIADICIVAQAYNAHRWGLDLVSYPAIARIEKHCLEMSEFRAAHPDEQPEAGQD